MSTAIHGMRSVLKALAEARDGPFYSLWIDLGYDVETHGVPKIRFRIYNVADSAEVVVALWVECHPTGGMPVNWGLTVKTHETELVVGGEISIEREDGCDNVVEMSERTSDPSHAANLVRRFAEGICARRDCVDGLRDRAADGDRGP